LCRTLLFSSALPWKDPSSHPRSDTDPLAGAEVLGPDVTSHGGYQTNDPVLRQNLVLIENIDFIGSKMQLIGP
jgi:hypothetical protein